MMSSLPASRLVDVVGGVVTASEGEKRQVMRNDGDDDDAQANSMFQSYAVNPHISLGF